MSGLDGVLRHRIRAWLLLGAVGLAFSGWAEAAPKNDFLLVLDQRAGPYRYFDSFKKGKPDAYTAALAAFGKPTRFRSEPGTNACPVTWGEAGITITFASYPPRPCSAASLFTSAWLGMTLFGPRWHNRLGIGVGDSITAVRRAYPAATFDRYQRDWLVLRRLRVDEFNFIHLAVVVNRYGRVTSIEVPPTYIY